MSSPPIQRTLGRPPDRDDATLSWVQYVLAPLAGSLRKWVNVMAMPVVENLTASATVDPRTDLVLVDATAGAVTVTLDTTTRKNGGGWSKRVVVFKTDASGHAVTVTPVSGPSTAAARWNSVEVFNDGNGTYYGR